MKRTFEVEPKTNLSLQNEIEAFLEKYCDALKYHRTTLLKQIENAKASKENTVLVHQQNLEKRLAEAKDTTLFVEAHLNDGSDAEILNLIAVLLRRLDYCQQMKSALEIRISEIKFLPEVRAPANQSQNNIPLYGIIVTQTAEPKLCTLETEGPIVLRVHQKAELRMISRDADGQKLCHGGLNLVINIKYSDVSIKSVTSEVQDKRDGTYIISFTPDRSGILSMSVKVYDHHVKVKTALKNFRRPILISLSHCREAPSRFALVPSGLTRDLSIVAHFARVTDPKMQCARATVTCLEATKAAATAMTVIPERGIGLVVATSWNHPNVQPRTPFAVKVDASLNQPRRRFSSEILTKFKTFVVKMLCMVNFDACVEFIILNEHSSVGVSLLSKVM